MEVAESFLCGLLLLAKDRPEMDSSGGRTVAAEIAASNFNVSSAVGKLKALSLRSRDGAREVHWRALPCAFPADL